MTLIPIPSGARFTDVEWDTDFRQQRNYSEWSNTSKGVGLPGVEKWYARGVLRPQGREMDVRRWRAFLWNLRGNENEFRLPFCVNQTSGNPTVASAPGENLLTLDSTLMLEPGMAITIPLPNGHERLSIVTGKAGSQISFQPALPMAPANGAEIEAVNPFALMRLIEPRQGYKDVNGLAAFRFDAEEAI